MPLVYSSQKSMLYAVNVQQIVVTVVDSLLYKS